MSMWNQYGIYKQVNMTSTWSLSQCGINMKLIKHPYGINLMSLWNLNLVSIWSLHLESQSRVSIWSHNLESQR